MLDELDLDACEWMLAVEGVNTPDPAIVVIAIRRVAATTAARFLPLPPALSAVDAGGFVGFVESPCGIWRPAVRFAVRDPEDPPAEPIAKGPLAATNDGPVSAAEQVFAMRATGLTLEEGTALVSRAAFRLGQGHARGEVAALLQRARLGRM